MYIFPEQHLWLAIQIQNPFIESDFTNKSNLLYSATYLAPAIFSFLMMLLYNP